MRCADIRREHLRAENLDDQNRRSRNARGCIEEPSESRLQCLLLACLSFGHAQRIKAEWHNLESGNAFWQSAACYATEQLRNTGGETRPRTREQIPPRH